MQQIAPQHHRHHAKAHGSNYEVADDEGDHRCSPVSDRCPWVQHRYARDGRSDHRPQAPSGIVATISASIPKNKATLLAGSRARTDDIAPGYRCDSFVWRRWPSGERRVAKGTVSTSPQRMTQVTRSNHALAARPCGDHYCCASARRGDHRPTVRPMLGVRDCCTLRTRLCSPQAILQRPIRTLSDEVPQRYSMPWLKTLTGTLRCLNSGPGWRPALHIRSTTP